MPTVQELYELWAADSNLREELDRSLEPRGAEWLFELYASLGPSAGERLLDVGARDARHAIRLERDHSLQVTALDPVLLHCEVARQAVAAAGADVAVVQGRAEELPFPDASFEWIWCRDVLSHVDVEPALAEFARVLTPGGAAVVYVTVPTELLEPREAAQLADAVALTLHTAADIERAATEAGLAQVQVDELGTEWRERMLEDDEWDARVDLLRLARLRRGGFEGTAAEAAWGGLVWGIYQLLGKLCPTVYVWSKTSSA